LDGALLTTARTEETATQRLF